MKNLGWRTICGAVVAGLGFLVKGVAGAVPELADLAPLGDALIGVGLPLAGIGVRAAIAKAGSCGR